MKKWNDIVFKTVGRRELMMDIKVPEDVENPPIILWVHGGGWDQLTRGWSLVDNMVNLGYAVASVDYRYSDEAAFPAQMYDLKDALLYVKKHGGEYGYDGSKVAVSGDSAGSHLGTLMAISAGNGAWEQPGEDYSVQAIVDYCGPISLAKCIWPGAKAGDMPSIENLLNAKIGDKEFLAKSAEASPLTYINGTEPPVLIVQGSRDPIVNPAQARMLRNALEDAGDTVHMYYIPGGVHAMGGDLLDHVVKEFLDYYIKGITTVTEPKVPQSCFRTDK